MGSFGLEEISTFKGPPPSPFLYSYGVTLIKLQNNHRNMGIAVFKNVMAHQFFFNCVGQMVSLSIVDNDKQEKKTKKFF